MVAATKFHQPNAEAHLISPYILAGHDTCMKFYYQLRGGVLNIRVRQQAGELETVWSRRYVRPRHTWQWHCLQITDTSRGA